MDPNGELPVLAVAVAGFVIGAAIDLAFQYAEGALGECGEGFDVGRAAVAGAVGALGGIASTANIAKKGIHIGRLGYHKIGKKVLKRNLGGKKGGQYAQKHANKKRILHWNTKNKKHLILKPGYILDQIKRIDKIY